jgi:hypothetical protein
LLAVAGLVAVLVVAASAQLFTPLVAAVALGGLYLQTPPQFGAQRTPLLLVVLVVVVLLFR